MTDSLAVRVEEACRDLTIEADSANDEELGEEDSWSLHCIRYVGLFRAQQTEIAKLTGELLAANTDKGFAWANARTIDAERMAFRELLQELIDIEGPQPGHVDWFKKVKAALERKPT